MADVLTQVEVEIDKTKLANDLKSALANASSKANAPAQGAAFGSQFGNAFKVALGAISFAAIANIGKQAFASYRQLDIAQSTSIGVTKNFARTQTNMKAVLNDTNSSLEDKANALNISTDKIYTEEKATKSLGNSSNALSDSIRLQERAFEDSTKAVENSITVKQRESTVISNKIDLLKKETAERVKLLRQQRGGDILDSQKQQLEINKNNLEIQRAEARIANDPIAELVIQNQINALNEEIDLRVQKLDAINFETEAIKKQAGVQEDTLKGQLDFLKTAVQEARFQLSASQNKFDIDIEPAKRKLQDLRAQVSSGGGGVTKSVNPEFLKQVSAAQNAPEFNPVVFQAELNTAIDNVYNTYGKSVGLLKADLIKTAAKLQIGGLTDAGEIEKTLKSFIEISTGKSPMVTTAQAIDTLGIQFQTKLAQYGESAGLQEEYLSVIGPRGLELLQREGEFLDRNYESLTFYERARADAAGVTEIGLRSQDTLKQRIDDNAFALELMQGEIENTKIDLGEDLNPIVLETASAMTEMLKSYNKVSEETPGLTLVIFGLTGAIALLATAFLLLGAPVTLTIAAIVASLLFAKAVWDRNAFGIQEKLQELKDVFEENFGDIDLLMEEFGNIVKFVFKGVLEIFGFFVSNLLEQLIQYMKFIGFMIDGSKEFRTKFEESLNGAKDNLKTWIGIIKNLLSGFAAIILTPIEAAFNGSLNLLNGFITAYNRINDSWSGPDIDPLQKLDIVSKLSVQPFAAGGFPQGKNALVQANENGQEYVTNARATDYLRLFFETVGPDFGASSSVNGSYNSTYQQNNYGGQSNRGFTPAYAIN